MKFSQAFIKKGQEVQEVFDSVNSITYSPEWNALFIKTAYGDISLELTDQQKMGLQAQLEQIKAKNNKPEMG